MSVLEHLDSATESRARGLANTHSRRSFLARIGQFGVALTGVGLAEAALAEPAHAHHVCGHTGTSPTCSGNPWPGCNAGQVEGGCWVACGCCGPRLRRLCDCCVPRCGGCSTCSCCGQAFGYCPTGYCVQCIHFACVEIQC